MFLSILIRFLLPGVLLIAIAVGLIGYGRHLESLERDAALVEQQEAVRQIMLKQAEHLAAVQADLDRARATRAETVKYVHKKVVEYVQGPVETCRESRPFVELFDHISGVPPGRDPSLPSPGAAAGQSDELPTSRPPTAEDVHSDDGSVITSAEVMQAYEYAVNALRELEILHFALIQWVDTEYTIQREPVVVH